MPSYLYFCKKCDKEFEEFHSISIKLDKCPHCETENPERLISAGTSFVLANGGVGWANTGYSK